MKIVYGSPPTTVIFPLPPNQDYPKGIRPIDKSVESLTGHRQVLTYAMVDMLIQKFTMLPLDFINGPLRTFFVTHALRGLPFQYFLDVDSPDYEVWELDDRRFEPTKNEGTIDRYDIEFSLRKVR